MISLLVTLTLESSAVATTEALSSEDLEQRQAWAKQMNALGQQLKGWQVNLGDLVMEGREELEERA